MAAGTSGREIVDLDDLLPEGWIARIGGVDFPIPGDLPMPLWMQLQRANARMQALDRDVDDATALRELRRMYDLVVRVIQLETPEAVTTELEPDDWDEETDGVWEPEYPDGAVVIPDLTSAQLARLLAMIFSQNDVQDDDAEVPEQVDPPKARRRASTTKPSKNGSAGSRAASTPARRRAAPKR